jgi:outer membrane protein assembly factor BamA
MSPARILLLLVLAGWGLSPSVARAEPPADAAARSEGDTSSPFRVPSIDPAPELGTLLGRRITRVEVVSVTQLWAGSTPELRVRAGDTLSPDLVRRALRELLDNGRYANASAEVLADGDGVRLRLVVIPRRVLAALRLSGPLLDEDDARRAVGARDGDEVTPGDLARITERLQRHYRARGFPDASVRVSTRDTDDPLRVVLLVDVVAGPPVNIERRIFRVWPIPFAEGLADVLHGYAAGPGVRADEQLLDAADRTLIDVLRERGWFDARVGHSLKPGQRGSVVAVDVRAGPLYQLAFDGNRHFDRHQLRSALKLDENADRSPVTLAERIAVFYRKRGFYDVEVTHELVHSSDRAYATIRFSVSEGARLTVIARGYPCLTGSRSASEVSSEIDSFLSEELPGGELFGPVDPRVVDSTLGPNATTGARVAPLELDPWRTYVPEVYERALKHLQDLYRSEGYLSAVVGPVRLVRRRCALRSPDGACRPVGQRKNAQPRCSDDPAGSASASEPQETCRPDPAHHIKCEPDVLVSIPIRLGPRTTLYDVGFDGNRMLAESDLAEVAELEVGEPVSQVSIDAARRRLLDAYAEEGFAFAEIEPLLDLSADRTRARVRFAINERERVRVSRIVVVGARQTSERLIRARIALEEGELYRHSLVRKTEERLGTLQVFSSVTVAFEDPMVPARDKVVVVTVQEKRPQHLEVRPGFSTGDGFRIAFEYGHGNLIGQAIRLTIKSQLSYLPSSLILEDDVRRKYDELSLADRLERRNSVTFDFPEIGLGPLFRLSVEGVDVRDNARDFGISKQAGIVTLAYLPSPRVSVQLGGSLENNDARIFGSESDDALVSYLQDNPSQRDRFRVPQGQTVAVAERVEARWDQRDNPLEATRGTLVSGGVEHVVARPAGDTKSLVGSSSVFAPTQSEFLKSEGQLAGYVRLSEKGLAFALSLRGGFITQLIANSRTYPDRLFFLGGVDSLRGVLQDSLVPEDIARELLRPGSNLSLNAVFIRGGDAYLNPRAELRIPLTASVQTAVFVDSGNLWTKPDEVTRTFALRYAAGTGLRIATPIGPLVFDYGFNLDRVLDKLFPDRDGQRFWEDLGAFHFAIGVF